MAICAGCRIEIADRFILRVNPNMEFHATCLKCSECTRQLDENCTAFVKNGQTFCRDDYMRIFGRKCDKCDRLFNKSEMVMRAGPHIYHLDCFHCSACQRKLETGEEFQFKNNALYCKLDCDGGMSRESTSLQNLGSGLQLYDEDSWETSTMTSLDQTTSPPLSIRSPKSDGMATPQNGFQNSSGSSCGSSGKKKKDKQTTRVRTVLNDGQLKILKSCYGHNSRPDAGTKEQLVVMTGLSPRVIRVWFQNKRCKDKKRQIQMHENRINAEKERALNGVRMSGIGPMIAAAPTTHVDNLGQGPIEIAHYPQWGPIDAGFTQQGHIGAFADLTDISFGMASQAHMGSSSFGEYSPQLQTPNMSSPSCSE